MNQALDFNEDDDSWVRFAQQSEEEEMYLRDMFERTQEYNEFMRESKQWNN